MDDSKQHIIKNIAIELDCGFDCYCNVRTSEIIAIPSFSQFFDDEGFKEAFSDSLEKVKRDKKNFIKFETLESFESFKIMERFVEQLPELKLRLELENVLANKKPFQNFKNKVDNSDFRQNWFQFKQLELEKKVKKELERIRLADHT